MGITFTTLPAAAADPDWQCRIHQLYADACQDIPVGETAPRSDLQDWVRSIQHPLMLPDCFFVAIRNGEYVGLIYAFRHPERADVLAHHFTGVRRDQRRLGIGLALKSLVTR